MPLYKPIITMPTTDTYIAGCTCGWQAVNSTTESLAITAFLRHRKLAHPITRKKYAFAVSNMFKEREKNDCTVRALAHAADVSYDDAHAYLAMCGRINGKGFKMDKAYANSTLGGYKAKRIDLGMTFKQLLDLGPLPKRCVLHVRGHVLAVIDGVVYDSFKIGSARKVFALWEFNKGE